MAEEEDQGAEVVQGERSDAEYESIVAAHEQAATAALNGSVRFFPKIRKKFGILKIFLLLSRSRAHRGRGASVLAEVLSDPPLHCKNQAIKDRNAETVLKVLLSVKEAGVK
jgi:hypothetical protein